MGNKSEVSNLDVSELNEKIDVFDDEILEKDTDNELIIEEEVKKPITENEKAKELIKNSKELISQADDEVEATKSVVSENVNRFEEIKSNLLNTSFTQSQILLEKTSYEYAKPEADDPFEISLGTVEEEVRVKNITSGGFTGLLLGILAALATALGWIFISSSKVGVELQPPAIPDDAAVESMMTWIGGGMTGGAGTPLFGMIVVGLTALVVGFIVYKIRTSLKEIKNTKVANDTFEKSNAYVVNQKEIKTEMERIDEHIQATIPVIEDYKVLLDEQNAKLQRVVHIEGQLEDNSDYHSSSKQIMQESEKLMNRVEALITIPVTKEGKLNEASYEALMEAKALYDGYIAKIYA